MNLKITTSSGLSVGSGISSLLRRVVAQMNVNSGKIIATGLQATTRNHFSTIYPGSQHYSPDKVNIDAQETQRSTGTVNIDVPGVGRAYHDVTIRPIHAKALTIPLHQSAYGKKASEFDNLFVVKKKNGSAFLAQNKGGSLTFMYVLAKSAFQKQDSRLMPSDDTFAENCFARLKPYLSKATQQEIMRV